MQDILLPFQGILHTNCAIKILDKVFIFVKPILYSFSQIFLNLQYGCNVCHWTSCKLQLLDQLSNLPCLMVYTYLTISAPLPFHLTIVSRLLLNSLMDFGKVSPILTRKYLCTYIIFISEWFFGLTLTSPYPHTTSP